MASGKVFIWENEFVRDAWPDCDKLFEYLPAVYLHTLGQTQYRVAYEDTEFMAWDEPIDPKDMELSRRLSSFIDWLKWAATVVGNAEWEVWT